MTEKRSEYRKNIERQNKVHKKNIFTSLKNIFQTSDEDIDPNDSNTTFEDEENIQLNREDKISNLKRKLNWAILIVVVLIAIVLFALFKL